MFLLALRHSEITAQDGRSTEMVNHRQEHPAPRHFSRLSRYLFEDASARPSITGNTEKNRRFGGAAFDYPAGDGGGQEDPLGARDSRVARKYPRDVIKSYRFVVNRVIARVTTRPE